MTRQSGLKTFRNLDGMLDHLNTCIPRKIMGKFIEFFLIMGNTCIILHVTWHDTELNM
ncbi:MAG TPA: hypothetical protein VKM55_20580 [Candidatus Lokiarchaeia archaeon]|nr:hypothetical protein [Candidatus Lokiarchaeia archaeon]